MGKSLLLTSWEGGAEGVPVLYRALYILSSGRNGSREVRWGFYQSCPLGAVAMIPSHVNCYQSNCIADNDSG